MNPLDFVSSLAKFIDPPDDAMHQRRWRITMSVGAVLVAGHILWACGYGHHFGIKGFVKEDDYTVVLDEIRSDIKAIGIKIDAHDTKLASIDANALQTNLFQTKKAECKAGKNQYIAHQMDKLMTEYQAKNNGATWPVPACENILE